MLSTLQAERPGAVLALITKTVHPRQRQCIGFVLPHSSVFDVCEVEYKLTSLVLTIITVISRS